nr:MAG TPA: hypothetical protein [Caudoviricetes sp.]DAL80375.1 MAG TPA: hypothetical protein [Caudoviricetes sp.]DAR45852.1 MAG TPA: hypothetical protein [Bacteriophage sp.]
MNILHYSFSDKLLIRRFPVTATQFLKLRFIRLIFSTPYLG